VTDGWESREDVFPTLNILLRDAPAKIEDVARIGEASGNEEMVKSEEVVWIGERGRRGR